MRAKIEIPYPKPGDIITTIDKKGHVEVLSVNVDRLTVRYVGEEGEMIKEAEYPLCDWYKTLGSKETKLKRKD